MSVIGISVDEEAMVCFKCCVENHYDSRHTPVLGDDLPDGFTCVDCGDVIKACPLFPTMIVMNTGIMRNGEIEFTVEVRDDETGMETCYTGYGLGNIPIPPQWGGSYTTWIGEDDEYPF